MLFAGLFIVLNALALTLAPAVRQHSWDVDYRLGHWLGVAAWALVFGLVHRQSWRWLPDRDPYLLPAAALLVGWGLLIIWRLLPAFGLRQGAWLVVGGLILLVGMRLPGDLLFLRRFKYLWLAGSLLLTALTLLLGVNPMGYGPRMWLGCCGIYLQPSEPLKLLLVAYLAAYLAERYPMLIPSQRSSRSTQAFPGRWLSWLAPTLLMTGLALALLFVQRDLGTAAIFLFLYAVLLFAASGRLEVLWLALASVLAGGVAGYWLFDVVQVRVQAWLNPWLDPSGRSYQIVQALIAFANGGLTGRGLGLGSPGLVPLAHSDLVFVALGEEFGLVGIIGLLLLWGLLIQRGLRIALLAHDAYRRYLAVGLTAYLAGQALLIMGGSTRVLPLTGVTLPFVSYGGSSLLTSLLALLLLLQISARQEHAPLALHGRPVFSILSAVFLAGLAVTALAAGWWVIYRAPALLSRTDNARRAIADRYVLRGSLLDRQERVISASLGRPGEYTRQVFYPALSNIVGYTSPGYGQSGLEASLDGYLRGLQGNRAWQVWWNHLLYGQPPPGLDIRLSLDLDLQQVVDRELTGWTGAAVVLNAASGEILAMASHPGFDANKLEIEWDQVVRDPRSPLLNRAIAGQYPVGNLIEQLFPSLTGIAPPEEIWARPRLRLPEDSLPVAPGFFSPLQATLWAAAISTEGMKPAPWLALAIRLPRAEWTLLPPLGQPVKLATASEAQETRQRLALSGKLVWGQVIRARQESSQAVTWFVGGTLPEWGGAPLAVAVLLEADEADAVAAEIGQAALFYFSKP